MDEYVADSERTVQNPARKGGIGRILLDAVAQGILSTLLFIFGFFGWCLRWTFATAFFVIIMALAGYYVFIRTVGGGQYVTVPDIKQKPVTEALYLLSQNELTLGRQTHVFSTEVPEGYIVAQRPESNKVVRVGRKVYPTVSAGREALAVPTLVGKTLDQARNLLENGATFREGSIARIPDDAPRDIVLAQDPAPGGPTEPGGMVHLLLSEGRGVEEMLMPNLVGGDLNEALRVLQGYKINAVPNRVVRPGAPYDVVLAQQPSPGTVIFEGQTITYDIQASQRDALQGARREIQIEFVMPPSSQRQEIRLDVIDQQGERTTVHPSQAEYDAGVRLRYAPGTTIKYRRSFLGELTIECYLDGALVRSYYYQGDTEPEIMDYAPLN